MKIWDTEGTRIYENRTTNMVKETDPGKKYTYALRCKMDVNIIKVHDVSPASAPEFDDPCLSCNMTCKHNTNSDKKITFFKTAWTPEIINFLEGIKEQMIAEPFLDWHAGVMQLAAAAVYNNKEKPHGTETM